MKHSGLLPGLHACLSQQPTSPAHGPPPAPQGSRAESSRHSAVSYLRNGQCPHSAFLANAELKYYSKQQCGLDTLPQVVFCAGAVLCDPCLNVLSSKLSVLSRHIGFVPIPNVASACLLAAYFMACTVLPGSFPGRWR